MMNARNKDWYKKTKNKTQKKQEKYPKNAYFSVAAVGYFAVVAAVEKMTAVGEFAVAVAVVMVVVDRTVSRVHLVAIGCLVHLVPLNCQTDRVDY